MKKYNISKPEKYNDKSGAEKTYWSTVGTMIEFAKPDGSISRIIEIPAIGLKANVFEFKEKTENAEIVETQEEIREPHIDPSDGRDLNAGDIPF